MSIVFAIGIVGAVVALLMQNARLSRRINVLQTRDEERLYEIKQLEEIILKYGQEKQETKD